MKRRIEPRKVIKGLHFRFGPADPGPDGRVLPGLDGDAAAYGAMVSTLREMERTFGRGTRRFVSDRGQEMAIELGERGAPPAQLAGASLSLRIDRALLEVFCRFCQEEARARSWGALSDELQMYFGCEFDLQAIMASADAALSPREQRRLDHKFAGLRKVMKRSLRRR